MERIVKRSLNRWWDNESFKEIEGLVSVYFKRGGSHAGYRELGFRQIWIYTPVEFSRVCANCPMQNAKMKIDIYLLETPPGIFYDRDFASEPECFCKIYVNDIFAGYYCPAKQSLALTDWTHEEACIKTFKEAFPILIEKLGLKPLEEAEKQEEEQEFKITLGADPEFEELKNPREYSPIPTSYKGTHPADEIGCDGAGVQIEIRPKAKEDETSLVEELEWLIRRITVPISTKGDVYPLGGHIHIGLPSVYHTESNIQVLVKLLDKFLGKSLIKLSGSARGDYKQLSRYEVKNWGFEYRSLPSAVFHNPEVARIVLKIARQLTITALKKKEFEIPEKVSYQEYKEWCNLSEEEYKFLKNFIKEYQNYDGLPINVNWGGEIKIRLKIYFNDDWQYPNQLLFDEELQEFKEEFFEKDIYEISLFGLKESRGEVVAGFTAEGFTTIEHTAAGRTSFGLPWSVRMKDVSQEVVQRIVKGIVEKVKSL